MSNMPRPVGVLMLVVIYIILAILRFGASLLLVTSEGSESSVMVFCLAPNIILGIIYLLIAVGLYGLKKWAWILALVFSILSVFYAILNIYGITVGIDLVSEVDISNVFLAVPIIALILNIIVLLVLWRNKDLFD